MGRLPLLDTEFDVVRSPHLSRKVLKRVKSRLEVNASVNKVIDLIDALERGEVRPREGEPPVVSSVDKLAE